jgi:dihydropteroate synthase
MPRKLYLRSITDPGVIASEMEEIGVCEDGIDIMVPKSRHFIFMVRALDPRAANILKQEMLAVGGDAAISYHAVTDWTKETDAHIIGSERQLRIALGKLKKQPFGLKELSVELETGLEHLAKPPTRDLTISGHGISIGRRTLIMGVLNVTPDSFSDGGQYRDADAAIRHAENMMEKGADIIDVGGESTRPGADSVSSDEELERVIPVIRGLTGLNVPISIDTRKPEVAAKAIEAGAGMVNLVGGLRSDGMAKLIAEHGVPVALMHMQGEPSSMQDDPSYRNVMDDIVEDLAGQIKTAVKAGIQRDNVMVDPGIGFGKSVDHNLDILKRLGELRILGAPIILGASRKSFIGKLTGAEAGERLEGSLAAAVLAAVEGADILRVHDVGETKKALAIADSVLHKI